MKRIPAWFLPVVTALAVFSMLPSCTFRKLKKDLEKWEQLHHWQGVVKTEGKNSQSIWFALLSKRFKVVNYQPLRPGEMISLYTPPGSYYLVAFQDLNQDFIYQKGEPCGTVGMPTLVTVGAGEAPENFEIILQKKVLDLSIDLSPQAHNPELIANKARLGEVVSLKDDRFNAEAGALGLWQPLKFLTNGNAGLFFLEPYNSKKIPVLFVHGASGHASEWIYLVDQLDRNRFQPWVLNYPSGLSLDTLAKYFEDQIRTLQLQYQFKELVVVAHSMGGLVSRKMILLLHHDHPQLKIPGFISISSPWNGVEATEMAELAPASVPSWADLVPDSPYIKSLYEHSLNPDTQFYLLFGFKRTSKPSRINSDGTISLTSALDGRSQKEAHWVRGFNNNHTDILISSEVSQEINQILKAQ